VTVGANSLGHARHISSLSFAVLKEFSVFMSA